MVKKSTNEIIHQLNTNGGMMNRPQIISDNSNDYFLTTEDEMSHNNSDSNSMISLIITNP